MIRQHVNMLSPASRGIEIYRNQLIKPECLSMACPKQANLGQQQNQQQVFHLSHLLNAIDWSRRKLAGGGGCQAF